MTGRWMLKSEASQGKVTQLTHTDDSLLTVLQRVRQPTLPRRALGLCLALFCAVGEWSVSQSIQNKVTLQKTLSNTHNSRSHTQRSFSRLDFAYGSRLSSSRSRAVPIGFFGTSRSSGLTTSLDPASLYACQPDLQHGKEHVPELHCPSQPAET